MDDIDRLISIGMDGSRRTLCDAGINSDEQALTVLAGMFEVVTAGFQRVLGDEGTARFLYQQADKFVK